MMLFEVDHLTYRYEGVTAVDDLNLAIPEGSRVALLGANGSGKSTLLRLLDGLIFGQSGAILFRGDDVSEEHMLDDGFALPFRRTVGMVFQNPDVQLFNPTVFDEVAFGPLQLRWPKDQVRDRVSEILDRLRISHLKNRIPQRLSGGEKKRVALASVLVLDPAVLLLDEPTAALDPRSQSEVMRIEVRHHRYARSWRSGRYRRPVLHPRRRQTGRGGEPRGDPGEHRAAASNEFDSRASSQARPRGSLPPSRARWRAVRVRRLSPGLP